MKRRFLTAEWRNLAMLNYEVDARLLAPLAPRGTQVDSFEGRSFVSLVAFQFLRTKVLGFSIPFHRNFDEINLRFYVRRKAADGWRRGVVFVKELVPRRAIAWVARAIYNENYVALPMRRRMIIGSRISVAHSWRHRGSEHRVELEAAGDPRPAAVGSLDEFITEHYWGYCRQRDGATLEYRVDHPPWRIWSCPSARYEGDSAPLYGPEFAKILSGPPTSALLADGSPVVVCRGVRLRV